MPGVRDNWRDRFTHYLKLVKDQPPELLASSAQHILKYIDERLQEKQARIRLGALKEQLAKRGFQERLSTGQVEEIVATFDSAEKALATREKERFSPLEIIPASSSRHAQIHVAYLQMFAQLGMLNSASKTVTIIERSQRLQDAMEHTVSALGEK